MPVYPRVRIAWPPFRSHGHFSVPGPPPPTRSHELRGSTQAQPTQRHDPIQYSSAESHETTSTVLSRQYGYVPSTQARSLAQPRELHALASPSRAVVPEQPTPQHGTQPFPLSLPHAHAAWYPVTLPARPLEQHEPTLIRPPLHHRWTPLPATWHRGETTTAPSQQRDPSAMIRTCPPTP